MVRISTIGVLKWIAVLCSLSIGLYSLKFLAPLNYDERPPAVFQVLSGNPTIPSAKNDTGLNFKKGSHNKRDVELVTVKEPAMDPCQAVIKDFNISMNNYVMALSYWEQLTMATNSMCALVNFARRWRSRVVMPFTINAEFYGLPSTINFPTVTGTPPILTKGATKPINILYDTKSLNQDLLCDQYRLPPLAGFSEFLENANRHVVVLHINFFNVPPKSLFGSRSYAKCSSSGQIQSVSSKLIKSLNTETRKRNLEPFTFDSACCLDHLHIIQDPIEIARECGFANTKDFTLVFTVFRGYSDIPTKRFRLITVTSPLFNKPEPTFDTYPLSHGVISNATAFVRNRLTCQNVNGFVAIHLRTAKIAMMGSGRKRMKSCLDKTKSLLDELSKKCWSNDCFDNCRRYFVDYGEFGSHSYEVSLGRKASKAILNSEHIQPIHYNPREFGGKLDQGYVALVEQLSIAHSSVLILVGGGSFQDQIERRFIKVGRGQSVYRVCATKEELIEQVYVNKNST